MNIIYKGLQRSQISNVGLASTLTCALNLGHCFSVGWDMVCRLVFSYTLDNFFGSFFPKGHEDGEKRLKLMVSKNFRQLITMAMRFWNFSKRIEEEYVLMSETCIEITVFLKEIDS